MEDLKVLWQKIKHLYKVLCQEEWNPTMTGILVALLSILIMAWWRPWGAVGAIRNWGDWMLWHAGIFNGDLAELVGFVNEDGDKILTKSILFNTGSVIGLGFIAGAFISACLGGQFAFRFPPIREYVKGIIAGILMGIGAALAGGCNVGGMYNAIGNLAANGFAMWVGLLPGVLLGLWLLYKEMEHISWGSGGSWTLEIPFFIQLIFGIAGLVGVVWCAHYYATFKGEDFVEYITSLSGILLIAVGLGYTMQRGRWCMIQGFREPHMTGDCKMAKSVALSILIVAVGAAVLKYGVATRLGGDPVLDPMNYVRGTFGWGGVVGGFIFGLGAMLAGGCGSGALWRVGEGQIKLWVVVPFFSISNSLMVAWFSAYNFEEKGYLGKYLYLPDALGYGYTMALILAFCTIWYLVVTWNEDTNKLLLPM
ncbi:YeeE/YedE thiosulfate transporter family protein [Desulfobulbus sp.]|uniref:YeeE/YedE thiosulfate transporter family protein n=1 Tax=Desulfobulbus sp. TaxID=895 RepID=UPI00286F3A96|nr:YeeE/YedE thiosulfate transporter family protein [Desulfobulbus sp.]